MPPPEERGSGNAIAELGRRVGSVLYRPRLPVLVYLGLAAICGGLAGYAVSVGAWLSLAGEVVVGLFCLLQAAHAYHLADGKMVVSPTGS